MQFRLDKRFDEFKATGRLPTPDGVALAILQLAKSESATVAEISRVLTSDPAMAGRILKLANSAWTGAKHRVTTVQKAVARLGIRVVRDVALGFSLVGTSGNGACAPFDYRGFWSGCLASAVAAQALGRRRTGFSADEAFTCGLLCRIGYLGLASIYPDEYGKILAACGGMNSPELLKKEREWFAADHNELSAALLQDWGIPDLCTRAVYHHEQPDDDRLSKDSTEFALAKVLHVAVHFARVCVEHENREELLPELFARSQRLNLSPAETLNLGDRIVGDWQEWGKILEVSTRAVPSLSRLAQNCAPAAPADTLATSDKPDREAVNILLLRGNATERGPMADELANAGHTILFASSQEEALYQVLQDRVELVLIDEPISGLDTLDFCKLLRQTRVGRSVYVILLTDCHDEEHLARATDAGVDEHLLRPCSPKAVVGRIRAAHRVIALQKEVSRDKEQMSRFTAELSVANRKLHEAALSDVLTGLPNRRYAFQRIDEEWSEAARHARSLACIMIDIDHFKKVNDVYGHDVGDAVLRETAAVIRHALRRSDVVCRIGGEEFLVICPSTAAAPATHVAERIREEVAKRVIRFQDFEGQVTISLGVAVRRNDMNDPSELLKAADQAVYAAKRDGRNRVFCESAATGNAAHV
jgi:two-component system, cell cycle response regulator